MWVNTVVQVPSAGNNDMLKWMERDVGRERGWALAHREQRKSRCMLMVLVLMPKEANASHL